MTKNCQSKECVFPKNVWKRVIWSAIASLFLLFVGYFVNNMPLFTGENLNQYFLTQMVCEKLDINQEINCDDAFFINVSYDKALAQTIDEYLDTIGTTAVTDRNKLYEILKILQSHPNYKYIVIDLRFDKSDVTGSDERLYNLICDMDKIVIVRDDKIVLPYPGMYDKSAYADYYSTIIETNFIRFRYLDSKDRRYIPLKVFEDIYPEYTLKSKRLVGIPYYTSSGNLCQCSSFIKFDRSKFKGVNESYCENNEPSLLYFNLGSDLLENKELASGEERELNIIDKAEDAIIIIGNYTEDLHDTYMGMKPGPYILYRAFKALEARSNMVKVWSLLYWFVIYMSIFFFIFSRIHILDIFRLRSRNCKNDAFSKDKSKSGFSKIIKSHSSALSGIFSVSVRILYFLIDMLGYTTVLFIFSTVEYVFTDTTNSIVFPTIVFAAVKLFIDYQHFEPQKALK